MTQLVRACTAAALGTSTADAAAARCAAPATTGQVSSATMTRTMTASMRQSQAAVHTLVTTGRQRYSPRRQKSRPSFPHSSATRTTSKGPVQVTRFQSGG